MGKSENGAVWLDEKFLSTYDYWQFWRNTDDRDVVKFLKNFTDIEIEDIKKIEKDNINDLKILLANETTSMLHGCLLYTSPSPRDAHESRMPSSA